MKIKFAHVSDCHLGAWRKDSLNKIGYEVFSQMVNKVIEERVDFVVISGDLYDNSNPKVEVIDLATKQLKRLSDEGIAVYGIMGSHDFSISDKSMIKPLISADFFKNVSLPEYDNDVEFPLRLKFVEDQKTKIKLVGMRGRKKGLEIDDYYKLNTEILEKEAGEKIFVLHTMLSELKPPEYKYMETGPKSILPENFLYYAGGHSHSIIPKELRNGLYLIKKDDKLQKKVIYPGCLFPTDFRELETLQHGGFCIISGEIPGGDLEVKYVPIKVKEVERIHIEVNRKTISELKNLIEQEINRDDFSDKIVVIRIEGTLSSGKSYEIKSNEIVETLKEKGVYETFINKTKLISEEYESVNIDIGETSEQIENRLISEHIQKISVQNFPIDKIESKIHQLISALGRSPNEGESVKDYDKEMVDNFYTILKIDLESGEN